MHILLRSITHASLIAATLVGLAACSPSGGAGGSQASAADTTQDATAIRAGETQWNLDWKNRTLEPIVEHYSHDAILATPGVATANGADAIRAAVTDALADPKFALTFAADKVVVASSGDLAYTSGKYSETATDPKTHTVVHQSGTYVTVYHKAANGAWKAVADIATAGPAAP
jgi:ketosteroid isomerase-like protein